MESQFDRFDLRDVTKCHAWRADLNRNKKRKGLRITKATEEKEHQYNGGVRLVNIFLQPQIHYLSALIGFYN